jgi:hypothetical protein
VDRIALEREQEELFSRLVEAWRNTPRNKRDSFIFLPSLAQGAHVGGNGLSDKDLLESDIHQLRNVGLISVDHFHPKGRGFNFSIPPQALAYYEDLKRRSGEPVEQVEREVRVYLDSQRFRSAYPEAYARWREAADLLWGADSDRELSTIGHKCREAIQEFVTALIDRHEPPNVNPDKAKTRERLSAVLYMHRAALGEKRSALLDALFGYWRAAGDLIQRQEHAGQREGERLGWEDGRRVVFQTAVVMFEIDRTLGVLREEPPSPG